MTQTIDIPGLPNLMNPEAGYASGGQPSAEQLEAAAKAGVSRVINLRPASEDAGYDEAAKATALGLDYTVLAIAGLPDLSANKVRQLDALMAQSPATPTLIHCASGNRVGALMALRAAWLQGKSIDDALDIGRRWGLTNIEAAVRLILERVATTKN